MKPDDLRLAAVLAMSGGTLLWSAWQRYAAVRRVQDTARSRTTSAPQGRVELEGIAWPEDGGALVAPDGRELVYYALELQRREHRGSGKHRRVEWVTAARRRHAPDFLLVDAAGAVRVAAAEAEFDVAGKGTRAWRALGEDERRRVVELLAGLDVAGFPPSNAFFGLFARRFRLVETPIGVGAPIHANGHLEADAGSREISALALADFHARWFGRSSAAPAHSAGPSPGPLHADDAEAASDSPDAAALQSLVRSLRQQASTREGNPGTIRLAGRLGSSPENPLYVADRLEAELTGEWNRKVLAPAGLGLALATAAAWLLLVGTPGPSTSDAAHRAAGTATAVPPPVRLPAVPARPPTLNVKQPTLPRRPPEDGAAR